MNLFISNCGLPNSARNNFWARPIFEKHDIEVGGGGGGGLLVPTSRAHKKPIIPKQVLIFFVDGGASFTDLKSFSLLGFQIVSNYIICD